MTTYTLTLEATAKASRAFQLFFQIPQIIEAKGCPILLYTFTRGNEGQWSAKLEFEAEPLEYNRIRALIEGYHFRAFSPDEMKIHQEKAEKIRLRKETKERTLITLTSQEPVFEDEKELEMPDTIKMNDAEEA